MFGLVDGFYRSETICLVVFEMYDNGYIVDRLKFLIAYTTYFYCLYYLQVYFPFIVRSNGCVPDYVINPPNHV